MKVCFIVDIVSNGRERTTVFQSWGSLMSYVERLTGSDSLRQLDVVYDVLSKPEGIDVEGQGVNFTIQPATLRD